MHAYLGLRRRRQLFVDAYVELGIGAAAVRKLGYKTRRPDQVAWKLLQDPKVRLAIEERREEAIARAGVRQLRILEELCRLAYFNPHDLLDENGEWLPLCAIKPEVAAALQGVEVDDQFEGTGDARRLTQRKLKYRHPAKTEALRLLMQFMKLLPQSHELSAPGGGPIEVKDAGGPLSDLELARRIAYVLAKGMAAQTVLSRSPSDPEGDEPPDSGDAG